MKLLSLWWHSMDTLMVSIFRNKLEIRWLEVDEETEVHYESVAGMKTIKFKYLGKYKNRKIFKQL